jgi:hypothetical protein
MISRGRGPSVLRAERDGQWHDGSDHVAREEVVLAEERGEQRQHPHRGADDPGHRRPAPRARTAPQRQQQPGRDDQRRAAEQPLSERGSPVHDAHSPFGDRLREADLAGDLGDPAGAVAGVDDREREHRHLYGADHGHGAGGGARPRAPQQPHRLGPDQEAREEVRAERER